MFFPEGNWRIIKEHLKTNYGNISKIAKKTDGHQNKWLRGEHENQSKPLTEIPGSDTMNNILTHVADTVGGGDTNGVFRIKQYAGMMCYEFAIESLDNVEYIEIRSGNSRFGRIYCKSIKVFSYLFGIPEKNENGFFIIPFWFSKMGIPYCMYHDLTTHISYHKSCSGKSVIQYKTRDLGDLCQSDSYVCHLTDYDSGGSKRLSFNHPVSHLIVKTDKKSIKLTFNNKEELTLTRNKRIGEYRIFPISRDLEDYGLMINFSRIDNVESDESYDEIYSVYTQGARFMNGMAGLMYCS